MILITGANGFIGSAMAWELNQRGLKDLVLVDSVSREERPQPLKNRQYSLFLKKNDIWDFLQLPQTQQRLQWIVHMGANSSTTEINWEHLYENNFLYSLRLFEWCRKNKKNLIYASSAATYGNGEQGFDDETDSEQLRPLNLYGRSKVEMDRWAFRQPETPPYWYGVKFFNVYGPNESHKGSMCSVPHKAFHQILQTGNLQLFKSYVPQYKDGEQMRDFVYVKEVTAWMMDLMEQKPKSGLYNMGFGKARTWLDLGRAVFSAMGRVPEIQFADMPENLRHQYQYFTEARMQKWLKAGLPAPRWSLEDGIRDYVQNYLMKTDGTL